MADKAIADLTAASALNDADLLLITQSATSKKLTGAALKTYAQDGFTVSSSSTLTNKTVNLTNNVLSGTLAQFNTALSDADFVTIAGAETLTSKSLTTPILTATASGTTAGRLGYLSGALTFGDGTTQQSILTTVGNTWTFANSTTLSAASTKTLTLNGGGGSNGLVLDASNNVLIGTASAVTKVTTAVSGTGTTFDGYSASNGTTSLRLGLTGASYSYGGASANEAWLYANNNLVVGPDGAYSLKLVTNGSVKATLDSSGNLGLGVTPSAWTSDRKPIQIGNGGNISGSLSLSTFVELGSNFYTNSNNLDTYLTSSTSAKYRQVGNVHSWHIAPSGVANTTTVTSGTSYTIVTAGGTNYTTFGAANNNVGTSFTATSSGTGNGGAVSQNIAFTQAMTLDANGNLLVGSTTALTGFTSQISSTGPSTNRGSLNLGRTTAATSGVCGTILALNGSNSVCGMDLQANGANNSGYIGTYTYNAGVYAQGPYLNTGGTSWTTASDERLKNIFGVIDNALEKTNSLRAIEYTLKSDDSNIERVGLVAQEVQKVLPQAVTEDTEGYLGVQYTDIVPLLVGAIQELSTDLNALKARIPA